MKKMSDSQKPRVFNTLLAINMERLRKGRSIGGLRDDMADAGHAIGTGTLNRMVNGDEGVRMESMTKVAAYFQLEVAPLNKRTHNGLTVIYGPHEHETDCEPTAINDQKVNCANWDACLAWFFDRVSISPFPIENPNRYVEL